MNRWDTAPTVNNFLERTGSTGDQNGSLPGHKEESDTEHKPVQDRLSLWSGMYGCLDLHHILTGVLNCYHTQPGTSQTLSGVSRRLPSLVGTLFSHTHIYTYSFAKLLFLKLTFLFKGNLENSVLTYNKYNKYTHQYPIYCAVICRLTPLRKRTRKLSRLGFVMMAVAGTPKFNSSA